MVVKIRTVGCAIVLAGLAFALVRTFTGGGNLGRPEPLHGWYLADGLLFGLALLLARGVPDRVGRALVLAGGVAVAATGLFAAPRTSDDVYRYVWDGQVQAAGISPYAHAPADPALAALRAQAPALFPPHSACQGWDLRQVAGICTHINRPTVHTIYPPVAEGWFLLGHALGGTVRVMQLLGLLLAVAVTVVLLRMLGERRAPAYWAGLWAWCPGVAIWSVNDAHVDTLGVLLMLLGLAVAATARRPLLAGVLLGAAAAAKLVPALALPGALADRRGRWRIALGAGGAFLLSYLPYVVLSGVGVIGYLPGYLREEGYDQGGRFGLLALAQVPESWRGPVAAVALAGLSLAVALRGDPSRPWRGALTVTGTALLLATPSYPWYSLLLLALAALEGRWEWLGVPAAGMAEYLLGGGAQQPAYAAALALVLVGTGLRRAAGRRAAVRPEPAGAVSGATGRRAGRAAHPVPRQSAGAGSASGTGSSPSVRGSTRAP